MDWQSANDDYIHWLTEVRRHTTQTISSYNSTVSQFAAWWPNVGETPTTADLERFVTRERRGRRPADATIARDINGLRSFYSWMVRAGFADVNPATDLIVPTVRNLQPKAIDDDVWLATWRNPVLTDEERVMLGLGFFGGLRCAELRSVRGHQFVVSGSSIQIVSFVRKGGGDHTLPLSDLLDVYGEKLPHLLSDRLSGPLTRLSASAAQDAILPFKNHQALTRALQKVQPEGDKWSPHALRHSMVTNLLRAGLPLHLVSRMANHSNVATTMRYVRAGGFELREWLRSS